MKTELDKHVNEIQKRDYIPFFGSPPRVLVDFSDGDCQVCLGSNADYISLPDAVALLNNLSVALSSIQSEVDKILRKAGAGKEMSDVL